MPPNCTSFPSLVQIGNWTNGVISDGSSAGRLRQGSDTTWTIQPGGVVRTIKLNFKFTNPQIFRQQMNNGTVLNLQDGMEQTQQEELEYNIVVYAGN
jgi:hypothetical protein